MKNPSLLPYLRGPGKGFSLEISTVREDPVEGARPRFPFEIIGGSGQLSRIFGARMISDGGGVVRRVFLLVSRDEYPELELGTAVLTNPDVEAAWRRSFRSHQDAGSLIPLAGQMGTSGELTAFSPLFVCTHTGRFFHPPCPKCGSDLDLVRDDAVLIAAGLKPYTTSLARYLACPSCTDKSSGGPFYSSRPGDADPACVRGAEDIVAGLKALEHADIPCTGCTERPSCHGDGLVSTRVLPFAFYPFHLFMCEAASLNAADFLALVSGAPFSELEADLGIRRELARKGFVQSIRERRAEPLLFAGGERRFLETLFLKLSFLEEAAGLMLAGVEPTAYPQAGPSLERMWIRVPERGTLPGTLWGFDLALMDMDPDIPEGLPVPGSNYARHVAGLIWLHTLLGSRTKDVHAVNAALRAFMKEKRLDRADPVLRPENIFWEPSAVPAGWLPLWEKALNLGKSLLIGEGGGGFALDTFLDKLRELKGDVRSELFTAVPTAETPSESAIPVREAAGDDARIAGVLRSIKERWSRSVEPAREQVPAVRSEPVPPPDITARDADATVVIPAAGSTAAPRSGEEYSETIVMAAVPGPEVSPPAGDDDFSTETVIMQHAPVPPKPVKEEAPAPADSTVIMGAGPARTEPDTRSGSAGSAADEELSETVIVGSGAGTKARPPVDELGETVIMGLQPKAAAVPRQEPPRKDADDELAETVIMKPEKK
ncbi:MAG TPA: hypothetical protein PLT09_02180 [Deltaproteobacteria bacterium]|nr:hypothetical protein [Deltaproteobacteria bacterium]